MGDLESEIILAVGSLPLLTPSVVTENYAFLIGVAIISFTPNYCFSNNGELNFSDSRMKLIHTSLPMLVKRSKLPQGIKKEV